MTIINITSFENEKDEREKDDVISLNDQCVGYPRAIRIDVQAEKKNSDEMSLLVLLWIMFVI